MSMDLPAHILIERQDGLTLCDHPLCDTLHQRFHDGNGEHWHTYVSWHIWDEEKDDYFDSNSGHFDTKRDAVAHLRRALDTDNRSRYS